MKIPKGTFLLKAILTALLLLALIRGAAPPSAPPATKPASVPSPPAAAPVQEPPTAAPESGRQREPVAGAPGEPAASAPGQEGGAGPGTADSGYLQTDEFANLEESLDLGNEAAIRQFAQRLEASKGRLSFPEYCYLEGRVQFARQDFATAARLLRQITDVPGFVDAYYETFYYLGVSLLRSSGDKKAAATALRNYVDRAPQDEPLRAQAQQALESLAMTAAQARSHPRKAVPPAAVGHLFKAERQLSAPAAARPSQPPLTRTASELLLYLDQGDVMLDEVGGRLLLVHFWASWCAPCVQELPLLIAFTHDATFQRRRQIQPLFVTVDNFLGEGADFLRRRSLRVQPLYWDRDMTVLKSLTGKQAVPATVLYDTRDHRVVKVYPQLDWTAAEIRKGILESAASYLKTNPTSGKEEKH